MVTAPGGELLVATTGGLVRFDGESFRPLQNDISRWVRGKSVSSLLRSNDGSMWIGMEGGGIFHMLPGYAVHYGEPEGLRDGYIRSLFQDSHGDVWAATDAGLFVLRGTRFASVSLNRFANIHCEDVFALAELAPGRLLVGGAQLYELGNGTATLLRLPGSVSGSAVKCILKRRNSGTFIGTLGGLYRREHDGFKRVTRIRSSINALLEDRDGDLWIGGSQAGLWRLSNGSFSHVVAGGPDGIRSVTALYQDADGRIWVGTQQGLVRLEKTPAVEVDVPHSMSEVGSLAFAHGGAPLLATHAAYDLATKPLSVVHLGQSPSTNVVNVLYAHDGTLWLGTIGLGVLHMTPGGVVAYSSRSKPAIASDYARGLLQASNGDIWVATGFGLSRIRGTEVRNFGAAEGLPSRNIRSLLEDAQHCLWIATEGGVAHLCSERVVREPAMAALLGEKVWTLLRDAEGRMWFVTRDHGIYVQTSTGLRHITATDGLLSDSTFALIQDQSGSFWFTTAEGVARATQDGVDSFLSGRVELLPMSPVAMPYQAAGSIAPGDRFPMSAVSPDGSVWIAYDHGAIHIAEKLAESPQHFDLRVTPAVDGVEHDASRAVTMRGDAQSIAFSVNPVFLGQHEQLVTRYRLLGYDPRWVPTPPSHAVEFRHLAPGHYEFQAETFLRDAPAHAIRYRLAVEQRPVWFRTLAFQCCCLLLAFCAAGLLYAARMRRLRYGFNMQLEERTRLAREVHDTLIQGCNGVSLLLEASAMRNQLGEPDHVLEIARYQLRQTVADARDAVWNLRRHRVSGTDFLAMLSEFASTAATALQVTVQVDGPSR